MQLAEARVRLGIVFASAVGPGGVLVCGLSNGYLVVWDLAVVSSRRRRNRCSEEASGSIFVGSCVYCLSLASDDKLLICGCDQFVAVYEWDSIVGVARERDAISPVSPVAKFVPPSPTVASSSGATLAPAEANAIAWDAECKCVWIGAGDGSVHRWDPQASSSTSSYEAATDSVLSLAWARSARQLASGSEDGTVALYDARNSNVVRTLRPANDAAKGTHAGRSHHCAAVVLDEDASWLACAGGIESYFSASSGTTTAKAGGWLATYHAASGSMARYANTESSCHCLAPRASELFVGSDAGMTVWNFFDDDVDEEKNKSLIRSLDTRVSEIFSIEISDPAPRDLLDVVDLPESPDDPDLDGVALDLGPLAAIVRPAVARLSIVLYYSSTHPRPSNRRSLRASDRSLTSVRPIGAFSPSPFRSISPQSDRRSLEHRSAHRCHAAAAVCDVQIRL